MLSDATWLVLISSITSALPPTIMAFAAFRQGVKNSDKADIGAEKADRLAIKTDEIHESTNSNLADVNAALLVAQTKIESLEKLIQSIKK